MTTHSWLSWERLKDVLPSAVVAAVVSGGFGSYTSCQNRAEMKEARDEEHSFQTKMAQDGLRHTEIANRYKELVESCEATLALHFDRWCLTEPESRDYYIALSKAESQMEGEFLGLRPYLGADQNGWLELEEGKLLNLLRSIDLEADAGKRDYYWQRHCTVQHEMQDRLGLLLFPESVPQSRTPWVSPLPPVHKTIPTPTPIKNGPYRTVPPARKPLPAPVSSGT